MKVLHAFLFFSIKFAGGTSDLMFKISKAQEKAGLEPIVLSGDYKLDRELMGKLHATKFVIEKSFLDKEGFSIMPKLMSRLETMASGIDVVHMHVFRTYQNVVLYKFCKKYSIPYILDAHGAVPYFTRKIRLKKIFDKVWGKKILRDASLLVAETQVGVEEYLSIDSSIDKNKIHVLSPPFDTEEFAVMPEVGLFRKKHGIPKEKRIIMFLGRVHEIKGIDFLIKGFHAWLKRGNDALLVVVGSDDGHMDECKKIAQDLKISDDVFFAGFLHGSEKSSALQDADIVGQMSRAEQGAWAPIEAVLCGTPIMVTSHTGAGEDVKRLDAGYLVTLDDNESLADTIDYIFTNYDEALIKTEKAKNFIINNLSMDARISEYTSLYEQAKETVKTTANARM